MVRRPDVFDKDEFQSSLRRQGCTESFVAPITSDFRLFVPLVLSKLGERGLFDLVNAARGELGLGAQELAWQTAAKYIVGWADEALADYREAKGASSHRSP